MKFERDKTLSKALMGSVTCKQNSIIKLSNVITVLLMTLLSACNPINYTTDEARKKMLIDQGFKTLDHDRRFPGHSGRISLSMNGEKILLLPEFSKYESFIVLDVKKNSSKNYTLNGRMIYDGALTGDGKYAYFLSKGIERFTVDIIKCDLLSYECSTIISLDRLVVTSLAISKNTNNVIFSALHRPEEYGRFTFGDDSYYGRFDVSEFRKGITATENSFYNDIYILKDGQVEPILVVEKVSLGSRIFSLGEGFAFNGYAVGVASRKEIGFKVDSTHIDYLKDLRNDLGPPTKCDYTGKCNLLDVGVDDGISLHRIVAVDEPDMVALINHGEYDPALKRNSKLVRIYDQAGDEWREWNLKAVGQYRDLAYDFQTKRLFTLSRYELAGGKDGASPNKDGKDDGTDWLVLTYDVDGKRGVIKTDMLSQESINLAMKLKQ